MTFNACAAQLLERMAAAMELLGENRFKVIAYQKAARVIGELTEDLSERKDVGSLTAIEGIGKGLAEKLVELIDTGRVAEIEATLQKVPAGVLAMLEIPGLGPKTAAMLWHEAGITTLEELEKRLGDGSLVDLPRMGQKTVEKIAKAVAFAKRSGGRVRIGQAMAVAEQFVARMRGVAGVVRCDCAGSLRRGQETIGDVDILASCARPEVEAEAIGRAFREAPGVREVLAAGATKSSVRTESGLQVDLRVVPDDRYGAAMMYFTGSKAHNVAMRERAIKRGMTLNEYGLWEQGADYEKQSPVACADEAEIYRALGLEEVAPELREDHGEIAAAEAGSLPELIELADIRAELHAHTTASDGVWSIEQLAQAAKSRGFHTVAVTDHSVSSTIANGLSAARLEKHIEAVREAGGRIRGIAVLAGSEVDILPDGSLDYPDSLLKELDIVVASPHASLTQESGAATARLLRALEHPLVHILGHPTGRLINRREGLTPRMSELFKAAAACGTAMEINANDYRLDLRDSHARAAIEAGVRLAINTDAHGPGDLDQLRFGVLTARRAWARKEDVINCMAAQELKKWLKRKR